MKRAIQALLFGLIIFCSLSSCGQSFDPEDRVFSCMSERFADQGVQLEPTLDSLEQHYIDQGILKDNSGQAKLDFYQNIIDEGEVPGIEYSEVMRRVIQSYPKNDILLACTEPNGDIDSTELYNSAFYQLIEKIHSDFQKSGTVSPVTAAQAFVNNLTAEDFERKFFRAHMLLTYTMVADRDRAYMRELPKKISSDTEIPPGFNIQITADNQIITDSGNVTYSELKSELDKYFEDFNDKSHVRIQVSEQTAYSLYTEIMSTVEESYFDLRNAQAVKQFSLPYFELSEEDQKKIKSEFPSRIIEVAPK